MSSPEFRAVRNTAVLVIVVIEGVLGFSSLYTLDETEQAVIAQFGELGEAVTEPGLHVKVPFIQNVLRVEKRLLAWDGAANQILTEGQERIHVDTTARWRVTDPRRFVETLGNEASARGRLDGIIDSAVRDYISGVELEEIVRSIDWEPMGEDALMVDAGADDSADSAVEEEETAAMTRQRDLKADVEMGRGKIMNEIEKVAAKTLSESELGIELVDVRLKRINFIDEVRQNVFDRMISERERVAERYISEGNAESEQIRGEVEKELNQIRSEAERKAQEIRAEAEAEAARIYAEAYGQDAEFYGFYRTLESYSDTLDSDVTLFIGPDSDYFQYLRKIQPDGASPPRQAGPDASSSDSKVGQK
jgi:membrane protease subunit HflC